MMHKGKKHYLKHWGLIKFLYTYLMLKLNSFLGFRLSVVRSRPISDTNQLTIEKNGYLFRPISVEELSQIEISNDMDLSQSFIDKSQQRGDICIGAFFDDQLVGYTWRTSKPVEIDGSIWIRFSNKGYYRYKSFVSPKHRRKNLFEYMKAVSEGPLIEKGCDKLIACIESHNYASLLASSKSGEKTIGFTAYIKNRFGFYSWDSPGAKRHDVHIFLKEKDDSIV